MGTYTYEVIALYGSIPSAPSPTCTVTVPVLSPADLACEPSGFEVTLTWTNLMTYDEIGVTRNGEPVGTYGGSTTTLVDTVPAYGVYTYEVVGLRGAELGEAAVCTVEAIEVLFVRGDTNSDGAVDISDAVFMLNFLFRSGRPMGCMEAGNVNDDSTIDIGDVIYLIGYIFRGTAAPRPPFPTCGSDPGSGLGCESYPHCMRR